MGGWGKTLVAHLFNYMSTNLVPLEAKISVYEFTARVNLNRFFSKVKLEVVNDIHTEITDMPQEAFCYSIDWNLRYIWDRYQH